MSCCAPRWPVSRPAGRRTHCGTSSSCCARTASCTCSDMTTPTPMSMPPCSACKNNCSAPGGRSAGAAFAQSVHEQLAVRELDRHVDVAWHVTLVEINLLEQRGEKY